MKNKETLKKYKVVKLFFGEDVMKPGQIVFLSDTDFKRYQKHVVPFVEEKPANNPPAGNPPAVTSTSGKDKGTEPAK